MGLAPPLPLEHKPRRWHYARGWYRLSRNLGNTRRFSLRIGAIAYLDGPPTRTSSPEHRLVVEQDHIDAQREGAWMQ